MSADKTEELEAKDASPAPEDAGEVVDGQLSLIELGEPGTEPDGAPEADQPEPEPSEEAEVQQPKKLAKRKKFGKSDKSNKPVKSVKLRKKLRPRAPRAEAPLWSVIVMAVVVAGLAAGTFVLRRSASETLSQDEIDKAVRTAAATAQHISSWDYRTIETDTKQVLGETTGDFREAYEKSAAKLLATAGEQEAVTVGLTSKAGVESVRDGQVKVLVFLNQQTTKKDADAHIEQHRLLLTMVRKDGDWLVAKLDVLG